jgi:hypothetical protein
MPWPQGDLYKTKLPKYRFRFIDVASKCHLKVSSKLVQLFFIKVNIHERYAEGVDMYTKTRTWSTAKSIATLIGMLVDQGKMELDSH